LIVECAGTVHTLLGGIGAWEAVGLLIGR